MNPESAFSLRECGLSHFPYKDKDKQIDSRLHNQHLLFHTCKTMRN